jgi:hypothetical protein
VTNPDPNIVMAGLVPAIHGANTTALALAIEVASTSSSNADRSMDGRDKPGHDE